MTLKYRDLFNINFDKGKIIRDYFMTIWIKRFNVISRYFDFL